MTLFVVSGDKAEVLEPTSFRSRYMEDHIQGLVDANPQFVNDGIPMLSLKREIQTRHDHSIDNMFIDGNGTIVVAEMKRGRAPREVVAQVLDYAAHVSRFEWDDVDTLCREKLGTSVDIAFEGVFGRLLVKHGKPDHRLLVVAEGFDERAIDTALYMLNTGVPIALLEFTMMDVGDREIFEVRTVLGDIPDQTVATQPISTPGMPEEGYVNWLFGNVAKSLPDIGDRQGWNPRFKINKQSLPFVSDSWSLPIGECQFRLDIFKRRALSIRLSVRREKFLGFEAFIKERRKVWHEVFPAEFEAPSYETHYATLTLELDLPELGNKGDLDDVVAKVEAMTRVLVPLMNEYFRTHPDRANHNAGEQDGATS